MTDEEAYEMYEAAMTDMMNGGPYKTITESTAAIVHSLAKRLAAGAIERADAEKDAALTDDEIREVFLCVTGFDEGVTPYDVIGFARAILAAKDK